MTDTTAFFTGDAGPNDDGVYLWTWTIAFEGVDDAEYPEHTQFNDAKLPGINDDVKIGGDGYYGWQSFNVLLSSVVYEHPAGHAIAGAHSLEIAAHSTLTQETSGFHIAERLHIDGEMTVRGLYAYSNYLHLGNGVDDFHLTGEGELRLDLGYITGFAWSITDFYNSGHITGHGTIGIETPDTASFPGDGGWLVIHNEAFGVIEADVAGKSLTLRPGTSEINPIDNAGTLRASNGGTLNITGTFPVGEGHSGGWLVQRGAGRLEALADSMIVLDNMFVTGGTFNTELTGVIRTMGAKGQLTDISLTAGSRLEIANWERLEGHIDNKGEIVLLGGQYGLSITGEGVTLTGGGSIRLINGYYDPGIGGAGPGAVLTNVDNTIHGVGTIGGDGWLVIHNEALGVIEADIAAILGETLELRSNTGAANPIDNAGILRASNGGTLHIYGTYELDGGYSAGWLEQSGAGRLEALAGSTILLDNMFVTGGTFHTVSTGVIRTTGFKGQLTDISLTAGSRLEIANWEGLEGNIDNKGEITLFGGLSITENDATLTGGGSIKMVDGSGIVASEGGATVTNINNTISGSGLIGITPYYNIQNGLQFINGANGKVIANIAGDGYEALVIDTGRTVINDGILRADGGGVLAIKDKVIGSGRLEITGGSTLEVSDAVDFDVNFVGTSHDTLDFSHYYNAYGNYDFDIFGMGVGDRVVVYAQQSRFTFEETADGAHMRAFSSNFDPTPWVNLKGAYSLGQFEMEEVTPGHYAFVRVLTRDGDSGNNTMTAAAGGERLIGLDGNDTLISGKGNDVLDGSKGNDTASYANATGGVKVSLAILEGQNVGGGQGTDRLLSIENLAGSAFDDMLTGDDGNNVISGGGGKDVIRGGGGTDTFTGGAGADTFVLQPWGNFAITVTDFARGTDKIGTEDRPAIQTLADIAALVKTKSNTTNAVLTFDDGQKMTLTGVNWNDLKVSDFVRIGNTRPEASGQGYTVQENADAKTTVAAQVWAWDAQNDRLAYSLSGDDAAFFTVDASGVVRFKKAPDFEAKADKNHDNVYSLKVNVFDGALSTSVNVNVGVTDENERPVISGPAKVTLSVKEGTKGIFHKVVATDPDNNHLTYSFGNVEGYFFNIDQKGNISFRSPPDFHHPGDLNRDGIYDVDVVVSDGFLSTTQTIRIKITEANTAPVITSNGGGASASVKVKENTKTVTKVVARDADPGTHLKYSIVDGTDEAKFKIDANTGVLSFKSAPDFEKPGDANRDNLYSVKVKVSDGTLFDTQLVNVKVTDVVGITKTGTSRGETLRGTGEQDKLDGKGGSDKLIGGAGADTFIFSTKLGRGNIDRIDDFQVKQDHIRLDHDIFTKAGKIGHLADAAFWTGKSAHDKSDRIIYDKATGKLFYDADGKGGVDAIHFATLDKGLALTAHHFDIIS